MEKNIVVTVAEKYIDKLNFVADILRKDGLKISNIYEYGVITGIADDSAIKKMKKHPQIASLTEEKQVKIPPPDADIQ